jgi:branched-chain amino acid transport system ATP-binding protein
MLRVEGIDVSYGPVPVLFSVSLIVESGELVAVLGGNASGKSTTIKSVLGLVKPTRGRILFKNERIDGSPPAEIIRRGVASIPEGRRLFPDMTVFENLLMGAYARRAEPDSVVRRDLDEAMAMFPLLAERRSQLAGTLSGGEQQIVAMARAFVRKPEFVCIDEPTMGLSPIYADQIYDVIRSWKQRGITMLMVEQSASQALEIADRAYVLRTGEIVLEGPASVLAADPAVQRAYLGAKR